MALHPDAQAFLNWREQVGVRPVEELTVDRARAQSERVAAMTPGERVAEVKTYQVPGPLGEIEVRAYHPKPGTPLPVLVFFHGGGWVNGSLNTVDAMCRAWANTLECLVLSVNYRHGPENKFPAAAEDAYAATRWASEHAAELGGDAARFIVSGASAGGNLAAVVSLMARDRGAPHIDLQILQVPITDYNFETRSYHDNAVGYGLTRKGMEWYWGHYLNSPADGANPYASPLRAPSLANLPPALVLTAEYDPLRDEGIAYAERLRAAGVPVTLKCYEGMIHPYLGTQLLPDIEQTVQQIFPRR